MEIMTKNQAEQFMKKESKEIEIRLFEILNNFRSKILVLEEEVKTLKIKFREETK